MPLPIAGQVLVEFATACATVATKEELSALVIKTYGRLGFDQVNVSLIKDYTLPQAELKFGWANTYATDWQDYYVRKNCIQFDPVAQIAYGNVSPFFWSDLPRLLNLTSRQTGFLGLAGEAGLNNGVGLPFPGARALRGGIALATTSPKAEHLRDLNLLWSISSVFYLRLKALLTPPAPCTGQAIELTQPETDILILSAKGETDRSMASQLGKTENTINTHLRRIYRKLEAHTRIQAFSNALRQHLIDLP
ncbi:helix-turn-helix transcriptional regulator [Asticcacaulis benevestitus]|uniref:HTH luxR-type domain-containing protein n=1 Tax=Asticcacaulis benevestitus DSM 16100 = ATCC BAA-896 TaxID=1121022 RepID=V4QX86_9CAUL|nr:autoinducer binding domain-containing protein [Asticcacaulis benevestitus]ESQ83758.1 hypothetical protein ABENE_20005 [Asticcacaulis benevestitus DSM 16100 = ATCC BAA-896]